MENATKLTLSVRELAERLGVSTPVAYNMVHMKGFPVIRVGKRLLIPVAGLERWLEDSANYDNG